MAYPTIKYDAGSRDPVALNILFERPLGRSRKPLIDSSGNPIQFAADVQIGDPVTAAGYKCKADFSDFAGFALTQLSPTLGVHTNGDVGASILFRDADIEWKTLLPPTNARIAALAKMGIDVLTTGL